MKLTCCIRFGNTFMVAGCSGNYGNEVTCDVMQQQDYFRSTSKPPRLPSASVPQCPSLSTSSVMSWTAIREPAFTELLETFHAGSKGKL